MVIAVGSTLTLKMVRLSVTLDFIFICSKVTIQRNVGFYTHRSSTENWRKLKLSLSSCSEKLKLILDFSKFGQFFELSNLKIDQFFKPADFLALKNGVPIRHIRQFGKNFWSET